MYVLGGHLRDCIPSKNDFWLVYMGLVNADKMYNFTKRDAEYTVVQPIVLEPVAQSLLIRVGYSPKQLYQFSRDEEISTVQDFDFKSIPSIRGTYYLPLTDESIQDLHDTARRDGFFITPCSTAGKKELQELDNYEELGQLSASTSQALLDNYALLDTIYNNVHGYKRR
jgi:hypothetical protein